MQIVAQVFRVMTPLAPKMMKLDQGHVPQALSDVSISLSKV